MQATKIEWSDIYILDNKLLDAEHKALFSIVNSLIENADAENNSEIINESLYHLLQHIESHFKHEEEFMAKCNYPHIERQRKLHRKFHKDVVMFCKRVMTGKEKVASDLIDLLIDWITQHILEEDLDIKRHIQNNN